MHHGIKASSAGYLLKMGHNVKKWKSRYFVLKPMTLLYYFVSEDDEEPRGCIGDIIFSENPQSFAYFFTDSSIDLDMYRQVRRIGDALLHNF